MLRATRSGTARPWARPRSRGPPETSMQGKYAAGSLMGFGYPGRGLAAQSVLSNHKMQESPPRRLYLTSSKYNASMGAMDDIAVRTRPAPYQSFWMPFTTNVAFKKNPRLFASAKGMYYRTMDG